MRAVADRFLAEDGLLILERSTRSARVEWPGSVDVVADKSYGDTRVEIVRR